jgi:hypothetical protein
MLLSKEDENARVERTPELRESDFILPPTHLVRQGRTVRHM